MTGAGAEASPAGDATAGVPAVEALLGEAAEAFEAELSDAGGAPLAVTGEPFAGRETILEAAAERLDAPQVHLEPGDAEPDRLDSVAPGPVVVHGCHHLYSRQIGGFERLDRFLDRLAAHEAQVVTGWNRYAWSYLTATMGIDREFDPVLELQPIAAAELADLLLERESAEPRFARDEAGDGGLVTVRHWTVRIGGRTWAVPYPVPFPAHFGGSRPGEIDPKDVVFDHLAATAGGNVGVARAIWAERPDAETRPGDLGTAETERTPGRDEAYCLRLVLSKEAIERSELAAIVGDDLDRTLGRLFGDGLLRSEGDLVSLRVEALPALVEETERGRFL